MSSGLRPALSMLATSFHRGVVLLGTILRQVAFRGAVILLVWLAVPVGAWAQSLPLRCWTIADGLAQSVANVLLEDSRGYVWIGTASGLSRFDGQEFVNFDVEHGLPSSRIYELFEDSQARLWAGTDRGVARLDFDESGERRWRSVGVDSAIAGARVLALGEATDGRFLVGTRGVGVFVLDATTGEARALEGAPAHVADIVELRGGLWLAAADGLHLFEGDHLVSPFAQLDGHMDVPFTKGALHAMTVSQEGLLLLAGDQGGFALEPKSLEWQRLAEAEPKGWRAVAETQRGRFFFGSHHQGLLRHDRPTGSDEAIASRLGLSSGLPAEGVRSLLRHSDGALWVGTYGGGVCRLADESFARFTQEHGLPNEQVLGLAETPDGALWIGMLEGGVARWDGEAFDAYS